MVKAEVGVKVASSGFPKLMVAHDGEVVLFSRPGKGMIVNGGPDNETGHYSDSWIMDCFKDFTGSITLSNEV